MGWRSAFTFAIALMLIAAQPAGAESGSWTSTASMSQPRFLHTATLLDGGDVLVAGGCCEPGTSNVALRQAELYRPSTAPSGSWEPLADLGWPRGAHTATLLTSGKVLIAGGFDWIRALPLADLYDPVRRTWSATGYMTVARALHSATLLPSGRVLVAGGWKTGSNASNKIGLATAELYDPVSGRWTATSPMSKVRTGHTATLLPSGKVLVAGGLDGREPLASAELYDPQTGTWSATGSMAGPRYWHGAALLLSGKVLVVGGVAQGFSVPSAELYDPATGAWSSTGSIAATREFPILSSLPSGDVLVTGGFARVGCCGSSPTASAERYEWSTGTWSSAGSMSTPRARQTATLLASGKVLVAGGYAGSIASPFSSAELYRAVVDTLPPVTTASVEPAPNAAGWNATSVTVTLTATDDLSGVASTTAALDGAPVGTSITVMAEGVHDLTYHSTDVAGNVETAHTLTIRIDQTPPIVSYSGNAGSYSVDQTVDIRCSASDPLNANGTAGSGIGSTTCQDISGPAYTFSVGTNTYSATATDRAGNVGSGSAAFAVVVTVDGLSGLIDRFVTNAGVAGALKTQLASIASAPNANAASGKLAAFANFINAQTGKSLTSDQAAILLQLVKAL